MNKAHEIIVAGFGGQGVLSLGLIVAYAAMNEDKEVSWMPSYGPEMRGGTANCIVIVAERQISSPIVTQFDSAIVMNQPSIDKFAPRVKPGGLLLCEQSGIVTPSTRTDIDILNIAAMEEAQRLKKKQVANMIILGAFLERRPVVSLQNVLRALKEVLPERHHHLIPLNEEALKLGKKLAAEQVHQLA